MYRREKEREEREINEQAACNNKRSVRTSLLFRVVVVRGLVSGLAAAEI